MTVLPNPEQRHIKSVDRQQRRITRALRVLIVSLSANLVKNRRSHPMENMLAQITPERIRGFRPRPRIFIQMESHHPIPRNSGLRCQRRQRLILRRRRRKGNAHVSLRRNFRTQCGRNRSASGQSQRRTVFTDANFHAAKIMTRPHLIER